MAEVIPQINIDGTKIKDTWTEKEYVTDEVYNALNKTVIDLKNNNNLLDSNAMLFREEYNSSYKNLNNAIHQGIYSFTSSAVNAPSGVNGGNLLVTNTSKIEQGSSIITQIAFCHNGDVYIRTKNTSENFTNWSKLAYTTDTVSKSISDKNGLEIDSNYIKNIQNNNGVITVTKGNNSNSSFTINSVIESKNTVGSGWRKYQDGFIMEWGDAPNIVINASPQRITFPVAVSSVLGAWATIHSPDIPDTVACPYLVSFDSSGMSVLVDYEVGQKFVPSGQSVYVLWGIYGMV